MATQLAMNQRKNAALDALISELSAVADLTGETLELPNRQTPRAATNPMAQVIFLESLCAASVKALVALRQLVQAQAGENALLKEAAAKKKKPAETAVTSEVTPETGMSPEPETPPETKDADQ